jgi:hypothetical protein
MSHPCPGAIRARKDIPVNVNNEINVTIKGPMLFMHV